MMGLTTAWLARWWVVVLFAIAMGIGVAYLIPNNATPPPGAFTVRF
jgi:hypothetical protein